VVKAAPLLPYSRERTPVHKRAPVTTVTPTEGIGNALKRSLTQCHFVPQNIVLINLGPNPGDQQSKTFSIYDYVVDSF